MLRIIMDGLEYEANIRRGGIGRRHLVTLARRFAKELA